MARLAEHELPQVATTLFPPVCRTGPSGCCQNEAHQRKRGRRWRRCTWLRRAAATATASNGSTSTVSRPTNSRRITTASRRWTRCRSRNGQLGTRRRPTTAPTGGRSGGRACPSASGARRCGDTDEGDRFDDFAIRQEWWTGDALPEATVVRRELAGVPKIEVVGRSKEKVEEIFWEAVTQARAELAGVPRK